MSSVNKCIIIGNLGRDPEVKTFPNGGKLVEFTVATSERWTDRASGEKKEKTEWHRVSVRNENLARVAENYLRKGSKVYVEGQLQTREWTDKEGQKRHTTEIVLGAFRGELTLLDSRESNDEPRERQPQGQSQRGSFADDLNDDVPF